MFRKAFICLEFSGFMNKSEVGKLGRAAVNAKYPVEIRLQWSRKGAQVLNSTLSNEVRVLGGIMQSRKAKSLGAFNAAKVKSLTTSEDLVKQFLSKLIPELVFESHSIIKTPFRTFEVDFVHYVDGEPKIIIEITSQKSGVKAESIAYKLTKLKQYYSNIFIIAIVPNNIQLSGLIALNHECNRVVFLENLEELPPILMHLVN